MKSIKDFINEALIAEGNSNTPLSWVYTASGMKKNKGDADKIAEITEWINKNYDVKKISVNFDKETGTYLVNAQSGAKLENIIDKRRFYLGKNAIFQCIKMS